MDGFPLRSAELSCEDCEVSVSRGKLNKHAETANIAIVCSSERGLRRNGDRGAHDSVWLRCDSGERTVLTYPPAVVLTSQ